MPRSSTAMSGFNSLARRTASRPSGADPTTLKPSALRSVARPSRITAWSSAKRTLSRTDRLQRDRHQELRSLALAGLDLQCPRERSDPLANSNQSQTAAPLTRALGRGGKAHPVVADRASNQAVLVQQRDRDARGLGVPGRVVQRFLDDPIERRLDDRRQPFLGRALDDDGNPRAPGNSVPQELDRGDEAQVVEDQRSKLVRNSAELLLDPIQKAAHVFEPLPRRRSEVAA